MKNKKIDNKTRRLEIRLNEAEFSIFKEKSKNYSTMSALIIDAVNKFDDRQGIQKLDFVNNFAIILKKYFFELNRIGNNINQISRHLNINSKENSFYKDTQIMETLLLEIKEAKVIFRTLRRMQNKALKDSMSLFHN